MDVVCLFIACVAEVLSLTGNFSIDSRYTFSSYLVQQYLLAVLAVSPSSSVFILPSRARRQQTLAPAVPHTLDRQHAVVQQKCRLGRCAETALSVYRRRDHIPFLIPPPPPPLTPPTKPSSLSRQHTCLDSSAHTTTPYPHSSASIPVRTTSIPP